MDLVGPRRGRQGADISEHREPAAPNNPDIQYHLAVALNRLGRTADAQAMLETLLGSGLTFSDRAEAEKLLQQLKRG